MEALRGTWLLMMVDRVPWTTNDEARVRGYAFPSPKHSQINLQRRVGAHASSTIRESIKNDEIILPLTYRGRTASDCVHALARVLKSYASAELAADIDRFVPEAERLAGKTARELLAALRMDHSTPQAFSSTES